jgi:hypothetical protein
MDGGILAAHSPNPPLTGEVLGDVNDHAEQRNARGTP